MSRKHDSSFQSSQSNSGFGDSLLIDTFGKLFQRLRVGCHSCVELFKFLPIRFKLSLIIGTIVVAVLTVFSMIVLHSQKIALMNRMTQVCNVLIQNLAESVKGDMILGKEDNVVEYVLRIKKNGIEGLQQAAVLSRKAEVVASFDKSGKNVAIDNPEKLLGLRKFTVVEETERFNYYYPITTRKEENNQVLLGVAYISFSKKAILSPIARARNVALGSALLITMLSIIGINLIARKMARQIHLLSNGAREVGSGNLNVEISVNSKDELGHLASEFNNMIQQLREKLQMQKFMSKLTVQMIRDSVREEGEQSRAMNRKVAVLFSDVRNFSTISEELDPEEIVKLINIYFELQTRIIESHDGIVDKFMGDQIMAIFEGRNMADSVLRAAVEIQRQIRMLNQERVAEGLVTLDVGIGINNGPAVMGHMGSAHRMDYTVIGDVVNVAARLCSYAKARQIITSLELARKVNGSYPTTRLKSMSVKGRTKAIDVCEVDYDREILI